VHNRERERKSLDDERSEAGAHAGRHVCGYRSRHHLNGTLFIAGSRQGSESDDRSCLLRAARCLLRKMETHFKGWAKPGVIPPGAHSTPEVADDETCDALSGHFRIFQLRDGYRFSTDDVLIAWYGTTWVPSPARVLDLGSGIGSVGMIAAWRLPAARVVTIEAQEESVRLGKKSAAYNGLIERYEIRHADFRSEDALGADEQFDLILASPPYFPVGAGIEGDHPQKVACRFELRGDINDYAGVAARHLAPGGVFAIVFPEEQRGRVTQAAGDANLTIVRRRPVVFLEGKPPLIELFAMMRAGDLPSHMRDRTWTEPALVIRCADRSVHPEYAAVKLAVGFPP
jgi:tRNA1(Val) A37 N6-methylase TrmN6